MNKRLIDFHMNCIPEYKEFLEDFNLIFYGYGDKSMLLREMFPNACFYNTFPQVFQRNRIYIILKSDFKINNVRCFPKNGVICTLDTIDPSKINLCNETIEDYNFIFIDLTTFEPYIITDTKDKVEINLVNLLDNLPKCSTRLFKNFLNLCSDKSVLVNNLLEVLKN